MRERRMVRLGNICKQDRATVKAGERTDLLYIGLESIEANTGRFNEGELSKTPEAPKANSFRFGSEHVLYGKLRPYLNKVALADFEGKCSTEIIPLLPSPELDRRYLGYFLRSPQTVSLISEKTAGARMPRADMDFVLGLEIGLPHIAEQHRIVDILSRAEGIVRLRRDAEKKAAELIPALFLDMFGDPATNPKGWPMVAFGDIGECRLGKMLDKQKQSGDFQLPYLRNVNVQWNRIDTYDLLKMDFHPDEQEKFRLHTGDILICEGGEVGRAAIWNGQLDECYYQKALHRLRPNLEMVRPDFVVCLLWHLARTGVLLGASTHATIAHLTGVQLKAMKIICAPVALQKQFEQQAERCKSIQVQQNAATETAQATFDALLAQVFTHN